MDKKKAAQLKRDAAAVRRRRPMTHKPPMAELVPLLTRLRTDKFRDGTKYVGQREG